ncbi:MAG: hypothetical protein NTY53_19170 [Kiritimatiellaeota bacterium]|nr:hypothetical protein [Kiritimatiellota bacterium]
MKRELEWIEKLDGGIKRTVRIALQQGKISWQFKRSDQPRWDHVTPPSPNDWTTLETKIDQLYYRRRAGYKELEFVRAMRKKHGSAPPIINAKTCPP